MRREGNDSTMKIFYSTSIRVQCLLALIFWLVILSSSVYVIVKSGVHTATLIWAGFGFLGCLWEIMNLLRFRYPFLEFDDEGFSFFSAFGKREKFSRKQEVVLSTRKGVFRTTVYFRYTLDNGRKRLKVFNMNEIRETELFYKLFPELLPLSGA